jgi:RNA polymerase sigma-70 factor (ECF subfamily)
VAARSTVELASAELAALEALGDDEVCQAVQSLPEFQRIVVYYADVVGFRYKEIAEILQIPVGTVMSRLHRGRRELRGLLAEIAVARGYVGRDGSAGAAA